MKQKWKQKLPGILLGLVFLVGLGIFAYPTVADQWNKYHQSRAIASYEETVADMDEVDYQKLWEMAEEYNSQIGNNTFDGDAFSQEEQNMRESKYWSVLNPGDNGIYLHPENRTETSDLSWNFGGSITDWRRSYVRNQSSGWW